MSAPFRLALLLGVSLVRALAPLPLFAQNVSREIDIVVPEKNGSAENCARVLMDTRDRLNATNAKVKLISFADDLDRKVTYVWLDMRENTLDMTAIPFAFRDAAHFQIYLHSDLYHRLEKRTLSDTVATAYGGFFQMFSRAAAVTEPKHLYRRYIGGDPHSVNLYLDVGARIVPWFLLAKMDSNFDYRDDVTKMSQGNHLVDIVEAPLNSAFEIGVDRAARYVNLISSAVIPIVFQLRDSHLKSADRFTGQERSAIVAWIQAAAAACSAANYQQEQSTLDKLKQAGLQVVPFDRRRLVAASWRAALTKAHDYWTVAEFDELVSLGGGTPGVPLPSEILSKLPPKQRHEAGKFARAAEKQNPRAEQSRKATNSQP